MHQKKVLLNITPQTWVRVTQKDKIFFRIPRDQLRPSGLKRRMRIERYNDYKVSVLAETKRVGFTLPEVGAGLIFYVPVPKSWSKKKKRLFHGKFMQNRPDLKNFLQAFEDSLMTEDKGIAYYTHLGKIWVNQETGWIEVTVTDPARIFIEPPNFEGGDRLL